MVPLVPEMQVHMELVSEVWAQVELHANVGLEESMVFGGGAGPELVQ